jgi:hypothetical protein
MTLTQERLKELLEYRPDEGLFYWRKARGHKKAGAVAGYLREDGFCKISIDKQSYGSQKLAHFYEHGEWPKSADAYPVLTQERLIELLHYDPDTGLFTRLRTRGSSKAGAIAGGISKGPRDGYLRIKVDGKRYKAHRLAFLYMTGKWPNGLVDHKDTNKLNNSWKNLRESTNGQNKANGRTYKNNKLGIKGVSLRGRKYHARIYHSGKLTTLGTFETAEKANQAYYAAATEVHGGFARAS